MFDKRDEKNEKSFNSYGYYSKTVLLSLRQTTIGKESEFWSKIEKSILILNQMIDIPEVRLPIYLLLSFPGISNNTKIDIFVTE